MNEIKEIEDIEQQIRMGVVWFPIEKVNPLLSYIKELEEGIEKHKEGAKHYGHYHKIDNELYKLIEEKP